MSAEPVLSLVASSDIPEVWGFVEGGLNEILRRCPTETWTPRDVRRHLRAEDAGLYVNDHGFVVLQRSKEAISGEPYLNVWLIWFEPGKAAPLLDELLAWLNSTCRQWRCEWWEFTSPDRHEWGNALRGIVDEVRMTWRVRP